MDAVTRRINDGWSDEDHQILLLRNITLTAEQPAKEWHIPQDRNLVGVLACALGKQSTQNDRLAIPNDRGCGDLTHAEVWQRQLSSNRGANAVQGTADRLGLRNKRARVIVADKFGDGRDNDHLNSKTIRGNVGDDVQNRAERQRLGRVPGRGPNSTTTTAVDIIATTGGILIKVVGSDNRAD